MGVFFDISLGYFLNGDHWKNALQLNDGNNVSNLHTLHILGVQKHSTSVDAGALRPTT